MTQVTSTTANTARPSVNLISPSATIKSESPSQVMEGLHNLWETGLKLQPRTEEELTGDKFGLKGLEKFFAKFLDDSWPIRKITALGNEIAESTKETFYRWLPKPIATMFYRALWTMAFVCTGIRTVMKARLAPDADKMKAACKLLAQDMVSTIIGPTIVANMANWIQDKCYSLLHIPEAFADILRPILSLTACNAAIDTLDPQGIRLGEYLTGLKGAQHTDSTQSTPILRF